MELESTRKDDAESKARVVQSSRGIKKKFVGGVAVVCGGGCGWSCSSIERLQSIWIQVVLYMRGYTRKGLSLE